MKTTNEMLAMPAKTCVRIMLSDGVRTRELITTINTDFDGAKAYYNGCVRYEEDDLTGEEKAWHVIGIEQEDLTCTQ